MYSELIKKYNANIIENKSKHLKNNIDKNSKDFN